MIYKLFIISDKYYHQGTEQQVDDARKILIKDGQYTWKITINEEILNK